LVQVLVHMNKISGVLCFPMILTFMQTNRCSSVVLTDPTFCFCFFQNNDDSCLAYVLGAISNLLSKIGMSNTVGIISSPYSLGTNIGLGTPLSIQQQLLVLLKRSLKRADILKLPSLLSFDHLSLAKFELKVRSLLVFGII
jgi:hypothetical protein